MLTYITCDDLFYPLSILFYLNFFPCSLFSAYLAAISKRKWNSNWQHLQEYLSPSKTLGSQLNLPLFLIIIVHSQSGATFLCAAWLKVFWSPHIATEVRGSKVFRCLWLLMPKVWISLKTLFSPSATRNKAWAGLNGNPACEALVSKVTRRQQMNPVVGVAEAMMERRRRQRGSFSQVIQGESNEENWRREREKPCGCLGGDKRRAAGKLQYRKQKRGGWGRAGENSNA